MIDRIRFIWQLLVITSYYCIAWDSITIPGFETSIFHKGYTYYPSISDGDQSYYMADNVLWNQEKEPGRSGLFAGWNRS